MRLSLVQRLAYEGVSHLLYYAIRSLTRCPRRYFRLFILLLCSLIMPFMLCIFSSSITHGEQMQAYQASRGAHFRIEGMRKSTAVEALSSPSFAFEYEPENGVLFATCINEATGAPIASLSNEDGYLYSLKLRGVLPPEQLEHLTIIDVSDIGGADAQFSNQLRVFIVIVLLISALMIRAGYIVHAESLKSELLSLYAVGASPKMLHLFCFFTLFFPAAAASAPAAAISGVTMKLLFSHFLQVTGGGYAWMVFHLDFQKLLLVLLFWFFMIAAVYVTSAAGELSPKRPLVRVSKRLHRNFRRAFSPLSTVIHILRYRQGKTIRRCMILAALSMTVTAFLLNYASINADDIRAAQTDDFIVTKLSSEPGKGFSEEEKAFFSALPNVDVAYKKPSDVNIFLTDGPAASNEHRHFDGMSEHSHTSVQVFPLPDGISTLPAPLDSGALHVWLNPNQPHERLHIGEVFHTLQHYFPTASDVRAQPGAGFRMETRSLTFVVTGYIDRPYSNGPRQLYCPPDVYRELTRSFAETTACINLAPGGSESAIRRLLQSRFSSSALYSLDDLREKTGIASRGSIGLYLLFIAMAAAFLMLVLLTIYLLLKGYMLRSRPARSVLHILGVPAADLHAAGRAIGVRSFLISISSALLAGFILTAGFFVNTGYTVPPNPLLILLYAAIALAFCAAFTLPLCRTSERNDTYDK